MRMGISHPQSWKERRERSNRDEHHFSWQTRANTRCKHEFCFRCSHSKVGWVKWISLAHASTWGHVKKLNDRLNRTPLSNKETKIVDLRNMFLCSKVCHKVKVWQVHPRPGEKPAWISCTHLSRVLDKRLRIMPASCLDSMLGGSHMRVYHPCCRSI